MMLEVKLISRPLSGDYDEIIYNPKNKTDISLTTTILFLKDDYTEYCGVFDGKYIDYRVIDDGSIIILTSSFIYSLNSKTGKLLKYIECEDYETYIFLNTNQLLLFGIGSMTLLTCNLEISCTAKTGIWPENIIKEKEEGNKVYLICNDFDYNPFRYKLEFDLETNKLTVINEKLKVVRNNKFELIHLLIIVCILASVFIWTHY